MHHGVALRAQCAAPQSRCALRQLLVPCTLAHCKALFHGTPTFRTSMLPTNHHCPAQDVVARRPRGVHVGCYWSTGWWAEAIESAAGREDEGMMACERRRITVPSPRQTPTGRDITAPNVSSRKSTSPCRGRPGCQCLCMIA